jgi:hypothetical protein
MSRVAAEKAAGLQLAAPLAPLAPLAPVTAGRRRLAQLRRRPPVRPWQLSIDRADADAPVPPPSRSGLRRLATAAVRRAPVGEVGVVGVAGVAGVIGVVGVVGEARARTDLVEHSGGVDVVGQGQVRRGGLLL